ncbi:probable mediator of RNA polymerase II transcription subunit 26c [Oryza brachyantha]|uniref:TFIIS N-terminal domain-containing protein n=1 Tax=Oryza brachyantha TaxID=4533 RepID=J3N1C2_ORYBR|nr:probable mediator of RNA polymerase II transcription subunit 26c [Oryza brachyantha]
MAGGEAEAMVREMVRSMGAEQLDEAIRFATFELAGRDISLEETFRLCDEQDLRRAKKPATMDETERIRSELASNSSEEAVVELLRALQDVPMTFQTLEATNIGKTISGLRKHSSEQVRDLAAALYKNWKALVNNHLSSSSSSKQPVPIKANVAASTPAADHVKANAANSAKPPAPNTKANTAAPDKPKPAAAPKSKIMQAFVAEARLAMSKRKIQEGYKDASSARKNIQVIDAPSKVNRRPVAVVKRRRITSASAMEHPLRTDM